MILADSHLRQLAELWRPSAGPSPWPCSAAPSASARRILFVSLGECITEKSGRVNLGLEGTLVMGAMTGYGVSY